jgi:hypothetical protein
MSNSSTFSVNGAADLLERDRRTIRRALAMVPPDAKQSGNPRWRLRTILDALDAHERQTGRKRFWPRHADRDTVADQIERITATLQTGFDRMQAERDVERRREMATEVASWVGALSRAFGHSHECIPPDERPFAKFDTDRIIGQAIGRILCLCEWQLDDCLGRP